MDGVAVLAAIGESLRGLGFAVEFGPDPTVLGFVTRGSAFEWMSYVWVHESESLVVVHGLVPFAIPADRREALALALTRANFGLLVGNFELDLDDGELRFKTSIEFGSTEVGLEMVRHAVVTNLESIDRYLPAITAVLEGADPDEAIAVVEDAT